jgi:hypothetical protein
MIPRLKLTPEQITYAKARYRRHIRGRSAAVIARELGVSRDGLLRHIDPEYRMKRNASAANCQRKKYKSKPGKPGMPSNQDRYALARAKVTLAGGQVDCSISVRPNQE